MPGFHSPQELYEEIEKQRQACERIIGSKDKLISGQERRLAVARVALDYGFPQYCTYHTTISAGAAFDSPVAFKSQISRAS